MSGPLTRSALLLLTLAAATAWASTRIPRIVVQGNSMLPTLRPGDRLAVLPLPPRTGRLVAVVHPDQPTRLLIKRVAEVNADGVVVIGDNPDASTDSRTFGPVPHSLVRGRPVYRYSPAQASGWLGRV